MFLATDGESVNSCIILFVSQIRLLKDLKNIPTVALGEVLVDTSLSKLIGKIIISSRKIAC